MNLYFVKHDNCARSFLFQGNDEFQVEDTVICSTRYGKAKGTVKAKINVDFETATVITDSCGAYWPLAMIESKYIKPIVTSIDEVPQEIIDKIRAAERTRILSLIKPELPFDV